MSLCSYRLFPYGATLWSIFRIKSDSLGFSLYAMRKNWARKIQQSKINGVNMGCGSKLQTILARDIKGCSFVLGMHNDSAKGTSGFNPFSSSSSTESVIILSQIMKWEKEICIQTSLHRWFFSANFVKLSLLWNNLLYTLPSESF